MSDLSEANRKLPELLAPAGNAACALAAFDAGADAIYAGLSKFNARERTENFTVDELARVVEYARTNAKKVYVTLNTLIKEQELPEVVENLAALNEMAPNGILVQDIGVLRIIREYFPSLPIHASTQMGFHNSAGLRIAAELGISRVVLERQITVEEMRLMAAESPVELEVFVHGALCCGLSGQCLFSSWLGGWSGNRGKCKQPCRRRYFSRHGNGFFFSTQDLCTLEFVPEFKKLGITALKIEGRLRQPDYVKNSVAAYRLLLDSEKPDQKLFGEARKLLAGTYGRKWSHGFYTNTSARELIKHDAPGASGQLLGKVSLIEANGFGFTPSRRLYLDDRIRLQPPNGEEGPAITVTRMRCDGGSVTKILPNHECFIFCDKEITPGSSVYKIGVDYDNLIKRVSILPEPKNVLNLDINIAAQRIEVAIVNAAVSTWTAELELQPAQKHSLSSEQICSAFTTIGRAAAFRPGHIAVRVQGDYFIPAGELKKLRQSFWNWVEQQVTPDKVFSCSATSLEHFHRDYLALKPPPLPEWRPETVALRPGGPLPGKRKALKATSIFDFNKQSNEVILPSFCPEERLPSLRKLLTEALNRGIRRFRITALYQLDLVRELATDQIKLVSSFPLPACNSMAVCELAAHGISQAQGWVELEHEQLTALIAKSSLPIEVYRYGRPPLLTTRATIPVDGQVRDARKEAFLVRKNSRTGLTELFSRKVLSIPRVAGTMDFYDLINANWHEANTAEFNFTCGLK